MAGSTISNEVTISVTVAAGFYPNPLTVTPSGAVEPIVGTSSGATGIVSSISGGSVLNQGTIIGGPAAYGAFVRFVGTAGAGVSLLGSSLTNTGRIIGGYGGDAPRQFSPGDGGSGVYLGADSVLINTGEITGGPGGFVPGGLGPGYFGQGGSGVYATNSRLTNDGTITGGFGAGDIGIILDSSVLTNNGTIASGGNFLAPYGGAALGFVNSVVNNNGVIIGGYSGVGLSSGGAITNAASGTISGRYGVYSTGTSTVVNAGTIISGAYSSDGSGFVHGSVAVQFSGTEADLLIIDPGAVFVGNVIEAGPSGTLELASAAGSGTISSIGTSFSGFGTISVDPGATWVASGSVTGSGTIDLGAGSDLSIGGSVAAGSPVRFTTNTGTLRLDDPADLASAVLGLQVGDTIDFTSITSNGSITAGIDASNNLTLTSNGTMLSAIKLDPTQDFSDDSFRTTSDGVGGTTVTETPLCFLAGTMIATPSGEIPIERLGVGELVMTAHGNVRPIVWIGSGQLLATRNRRSAATPVVVRKGALADNVPHRDLHLTKAHALSLDGVLIPVEFLVNHRSIHWNDLAQEILLYHIELESHDVLLANGAPAESYRDDGNRWLFQNANNLWHLPPKRPCVPVLTGGHLVGAAWLRLLERSGPRKRLPLTADPDLHILVDDRRVDASIRIGAFHVFTLATAPDRVRIVSRTAVPQELGLLRDPRSLGTALRQILVRQGSKSRVMWADDPRLTTGFHAYEPADGIRWTGGDAVVPDGLFGGFGGPLELVIECGGVTQYVDDGSRRRAA